MENSSNNGNQLFSSKDSNERRTTHTKSNNIEIMIGNTTNEKTGERFDSQKYEKGLEDH